MLDKQGWGWRWKGGLPKNGYHGYQTVTRNQKSRNVGKCWRLPELPRLPTKLSYIEKK